MTLNHFTRQVLQVILANELRVTLAHVMLSDLVKTIAQEAEAILEDEGSPYHKALTLAIALTPSRGSCHPPALAACAGERCTVCGLDACHKVEEVHGLPGHPLTAYLCCYHYGLVMGPLAREACHKKEIAWMETQGGGGYVTEETLPRQATERRTHDDRSGQ